MRIDLIATSVTMTEDQLRYQIGLRLKEARTDAEFNRAQLALLTGLSEERIEQWERGAAEMYLDELDVLCEALDVDPEFVLGWDRVQLH